ncbi:WxL domain-containing protein [Pediococcus ethanolidurans]|uniref:WxL domain surface cell wall-binding n=1 Tax=Pediococcus ethanolidurans TaxID=319653 RepID=A0A0R2K598_9LACO|nr:WxL domain-containing protein [Pediococcus ethanolidurans]KRN83030.1 hypothetical protein IV87_GL001740 [Pediococcus ethanolidurans]GEN94182.1 cell surface protein [Pediococcus ethanolidurans]SER07874.1 WxL domain surface cell wall-binding [Pediococcus ethanolidurans]
MNKIKAATLLSTAILGVSMAVPVFAAGTTTATATQSGQTHAYISFHGKSDGTNPLDPSDPSTPDPGNSTGNPGPLSLDAVPNTLNFGDHELSDTTVGDHTYALVGNADNATSGAEKDSATHEKDPATTDVSGAVYTQVTDERGTGAGWNVTAQLAKFQNDGADTLDGAVMTFASGKTQKLATDADGNLTWGTADITVPSAVSLTAGGGDTAVENAAEGTGKGTQQQVWENANVNLKVIQDSARPGNSTSTITWTLNDTPA